jgi:DNA helicase-2/ATP-dependent DNA helicase PcrA
MRRKHLPKLTTFYCDDAPAVVMRFKTHRLIIPLLKEAVKRYPKASPEWLFDELFTNRGWLGKAVEKYAPGAFTDNELDIVHGWCTDRHFWRVEEGGPNEEDVPTYDREDDMILLRLVQLLKGPLRHANGKKVAYDHLMVDEAQDFSPLELLVLLNTVRDDSVTLAGDRAQKIIEHNDFSDWSEVLTAIERPHVELNTLNISYRSTRRIMELAMHVLGPLAPDEPVRTTRDGLPVQLFRSGGVGEAMTFLADALMDLMEREPNASVAVLTRFAHQADEVYWALKRTDLQELARVRDQEFSFGPGIEVTDISQTKGLEFDYVVLLYVDRQTFPERELSRHLLHVGITRAVHQLWLFSWGPLSPLVPDWLTPTVVG